MFFNLRVTPYALLLIRLLYYLLPNIRSKALGHVPGPSLAALSNLWFVIPM